MHFFLKKNEAQRRRFLINFYSFQYWVTLPAVAAPIIAIKNVDNPAGNSSSAPFQTDKIPHTVIGRIAQKNVHSSICNLIEDKTPSFSSRNLSRVFMRALFGAVSFTFDCFSYRSRKGLCMRLRIKARRLKLNKN